MKAVYGLIVIGLLLCLYSCKKGCDPANMGPVTIAGKWNIVNISSDTGVGINNHAVNYAVQPGDYYRFTTNGMLYTKEGAALDTFSYTLVADTSIIIKPQGNTNSITQPGHIATFTAHSLIIDGPYLLTPGGILGSTVSLSR